MRNIMNLMAGVALGAGLVVVVLKYDVLGLRSGMVEEPEVE